MASIVKRVGKEGKPSFQVKVKLKGHRQQTETFYRKTDAVRWGQSTEAALREGRMTATRESKRHTVKELIERYERDVLPRKKDQKNPKRQLKWWNDELGHLVLIDVNRSVISEARDNLASQETHYGKEKKFRKRSPASVVRYMAVLSHAFNVAVRDWGWLEYNPFTRVSRPKESKGRVRYLLENERPKLLDACKASESPLLYPAVVLSLSTGARQGEVMHLKWDAIDFKQGKVTFFETKNGQIRTVALQGLAQTLLQSLHRNRKIGVPWVFPGRGNRKPVSLQKPWQIALDAAGIEGFRWHDLRHSTASYLAMGGASPVEIAAVLGHKTLEMVQRYAHLSPPHVANVLKKMNARILPVA